MAPRAVGAWRGGKEGAEGGAMAAGASGRPRASGQPPAALPQPPAAWGGWHGRVPGGSRGMRPAGGRLGAWRKRALKRREKSAGEK